MTREEINIFYYNQCIWMNNAFWRGIPVAKHATDLWMYSELIFKIKPDLVLESGTYRGGSALFFSDLCRLQGHGLVVSVGQEFPVEELPKEDNLRFIYGDTLSEEVHNLLKKIIVDNNVQTVFVSLDSRHDKDFVEKEIDRYSPYVSVGSYLVVEDTDAIFYQNFSTANEAVDKFMHENKNFVRDQSCEKFIITTNPGGWLKRV